jgi:DNA anti-recombination protein RmuC
MPSPASPEAQSDGAAASQTSAEFSLPPPHAALLSAIAHEAWTTQWLPSMQETLQRYMQERFKALEQQLALEQQRQRDHLEEGLRDVEQQLTATVREHQQHQQTITTAFRESIEHIRREFSAALQHLSEDVTQALRQTEEQARRTVENLRSEVLQMLLEHDPDAIKCQLLGEYLPSAEKPFQPGDGEHRS